MWTRLPAINRGYQTVGLRVARKLLAEADAQSIDRQIVENFVQAWLVEARKRESYGIWVLNKDTWEVGMVSVLVPKNLSTAKPLSL